MVAGAGPDGRGFLGRTWERRTLAHGKRCNALAARDGLLASVGWDGAVEVRTGDPPGGRAVARHVQPAVAVAVAGQVDRVVSGGLDNVVKVMDVGPPDRLRSPLQGHAGAVAAVTSDGQSMGADAALLGADGALLAQHAGSVERVALAVTASGAVVASLDGQLFDVRGGRFVPVEGAGPARRFALAAHGDVVAAAGGPAGVAILHYGEREQARAPALPDRHHAVSVAWVRGAIVVGDQHGGLHVAGRDAPLFPPAPGTFGPVEALAAGADLVVSGDREGSLRGVSVDPGGPSWSRGGTEPILQVAVSPDGQRVAALARDAGQRTHVSILDRFGQPWAAVDLPWRVDVPTAISWGGPDELIVGTARGVVLRIRCR